MKSFNRFFTGSPVMNSPPYSTLTKPDISDFAPLKKFAANSILCRVQKFGLRVSRGDRAGESARKEERRKGFPQKMARLLSAFLHGSQSSSVVIVVQEGKGGNATSPIRLLASKSFNFPLRAMTERKTTEKLAGMRARRNS